MVKSLAQERKEQRETLKSKIQAAAKAKKQAAKFAADIKAEYAKDAARNKKKSVTDRINRLANNPNAKIKGTTLISYMANNSPAQALRDLGILTPTIEKALTRKGPASKNSKSTNISFKDKPSPSGKKKNAAPRKETPKKKDKFVGEPRTIAQAKKMGKSYFINKAGRKLAAVTREDLKGKGLDPSKKSDLTKFLNMKRKK